MRAAIADTGPLNYLVLIDLVGILPILFQTVFAPAAVQAELNHPETPKPVREWIASPPLWLAIRPDPAMQDADLRSLDDGEAATIMLARTLKAELILMDDRRGAAMARRKGFAVVGTLGLLDLAARRSLVDLADAFERLRKTSFRYRSDLLHAILAKHQAKDLND